MPPTNSEPSMAEVTNLIKQNQLPEGFWSLGQLDGQEGLKDIHALLTMRMQSEAPDADILELMMMERVAFLYVYMRAKEASNSAEVTEMTKAYKDMMTLWIAMAADLRKIRMRQEEMQNLRMSIVTEVGRALKEAMKGVDPSIAAKVQNHLISLVA